MSVRRSVGVQAVIDKCKYMASKLAVQYRKETAKRKLGDIVSPALISGRPCGG